MISRQGHRAVISRQGLRTVTSRQGLPAVIPRQGLRAVISRQGLRAVISLPVLPLYAKSFPPVPRRSMRRLFLPALQRAVTRRKLHRGSRITPAKRAIVYAVHASQWNIELQRDTTDS